MHTYIHTLMPFRPMPSRVVPCHSMPCRCVPSHAPACLVLFACLCSPASGLTETAADTSAEKFESLERIKSIREANGSFDSCSSFKRLGTGRFHGLHGAKLPFVSLSNLSVLNFRLLSAHVSGVSNTYPPVLRSLFRPHAYPPPPILPGIQTVWGGGVGKRIQGHWGA